MYKKPSVTFISSIAYNVVLCFVHMHTDFTLLSTFTAYDTHTHTYPVQCKNVGTKAFFSHLSPPLIRPIKTAVPPPLQPPDA